jgi:hypothetical protein
LSLFFVTFSLWVPEAASVGMRQEAGYAIGIWLSWGLNLLVAEAWIRRPWQRPATPTRV